MRIFLVGMPGAGKSFWGEALSQNLIMPFFDLDEEIEKAEAAPIAYIWEKQGEAYFRKLERQYLEELAELDPAIIATGGGTPSFFDNMDFINQKGISIFLNIPLHSIIKRLHESDIERRPAFRQHASHLEAYLQNLFEQRKPYYSQAHITIDHEPQSVDELVTPLVQYIRDMRM